MHARLCDVDAARCCGMFVCPPMVQAKLWHDFSKMSFDHLEQVKHSPPVEIFNLTTKAVITHEGM